ncbi:hypothetical protein PR048_033037, partial [Dryococelus australis]
MMQLEARFVLKDDNWTFHLKNWNHSLQYFMREEHMMKIAFMFFNCGLANGVHFFMNRFTDIMRFLRFHEKFALSSLKQDDKFGLVSEICKTFVNNCIICYKPTDNIEIDEQLFPSKCRCPFTQYMPNKPGKFGAKYWLAVDAKNRSILKDFSYLGKDATRSADRPLGEHVVMRLMEPFVDKGIIVTTEQIGDKNVLVLSTLHTGVDIDQQTEKKIAETIKFYNGTKYGVHIVDQMTRKYTMRVMSGRWPYHVFYNILDLAYITNSLRIVIRTISGNTSTSSIAFPKYLGGGDVPHDVCENQRLDYPYAPTKIRLQPKIPCVGTSWHTLLAEVSSEHTVSASSRELTCFLCCHVDGVLCCRQKLPSCTTLFASWPQRCTRSTSDRPTTPNLSSVTLDRHGDMDWGSQTSSR